MIKFVLKENFMDGGATNYQCPACSGVLLFNSELGKLKCEHCDSIYDVREIEDLYASDALDESNAIEQSESDNWVAETHTNDWGEDADKMRAYSCTSCGAEIICDETTAATSCYYCGNQTIIHGQFAGALKPDFIIPFKLDKEDVKKALKEHCKKKFLLPKFFLEENHLDELKGVYAPFWLFSGSVDADVHFKASNSSSRTSGNYRITTTKHYEVHRAGNIPFNNIPVDSSSKMPDDHMRSIEPFHYNALTRFSTAYMPGFFADKFDVDVETSRGMATSRAKSAAQTVINGTVTEYSSKSITSQNYTLNHGEVKYAMAPVWLLTTKYKDKVLLFAMNGQTGKFVGDLPLDSKKATILFSAVTAALTVLGYIAYLLLIRF